MSPAVIRTTGRELSKELAVVAVPAPHLLHADHFLVLDVEHKVPMALLLFNVIKLHLHSLVYFHTTRHGGILCLISERVKM